MQFKLPLMLSIVSMIPGCVGAHTPEGIQRMMERINAKDSKSSAFDWGPTAEDIRVGNEQAAQSRRFFFAKRDLGGKLKSAVEKGDLENVKTLIAAGAELEIEDYWGMTPLMTAAKKGHTEIVKLLINAGAKIDTREPYGSTALVYAIDEGHTEIAELLIANAKDSCDSRALASAIDKRHIEIVKLLIANGADKKDQKKFGRFFMDAVRRGDNEMVKALIVGHASIDHETLYFASMMARGAGSAEIVNAIEELQKKHFSLPNSDFNSENKPTD